MSIIRCQGSSICVYRSASPTFFKRPNQIEFIVECRLSYRGIFDNPFENGLLVTLGNRIGQNSHDVGVLAEGFASDIVPEQPTLGIPTLFINRSFQITANGLILFCHLRFTVPFHKFGSTL